MGVEFSVLKLAKFNLAHASLSSRPIWKEQNKVVELMLYFIDFWWSEIDKGRFQQGHHIYQIHNFHLELDLQFTISHIIKCKATNKKPPATLIKNWLLGPQTFQLPLLLPIWFLWDFLLRCRVSRSSLRSLQTLTITFTIASPTTFGSYRRKTNDLSLSFNALLLSLGFLQSLGLTLTCRTLRPLSTPSLLCSCRQALLKSAAARSSIKGPSARLAKLDLLLAGAYYIVAELATSSYPSALELCKTRLLIVWFL